MNDFEQTLCRYGRDGLYAADVQVLQVNLGLRCNLSCRHCHVDASAARQEVMSWRTLGAVLKTTRRIPSALVDLTGGAPELNPHFRRFVAALTDQGNRVQVRTNLAVFQEPAQEGLPQFYREHRVGLVASLPCYLEENVRAQRGEGVYEKTIDAICQLNELGYGKDPALPLDLVYNPGGPFLPPDQPALERAYRKELAERFNIRFSRLYTITNMPIGRFLEDLAVQRKDRAYQRLLTAAFNPETVENLMCRRQVCVGWDGRLYDCDFNLALSLPTGYGAPQEIQGFELEQLRSRRIVTGSHCYACTAGCGSSCGGALLGEGPNGLDCAAAGGG